MRFTAILAISALCVSACATVPAPEAAGAGGGVGAARQDCPDGQGYVVLGVSPTPVRQGATVALSAVLQPEPWSAAPLPVGCLSSVEVSPAGAAEVTPGTGAIRIAADVPPGTEVTLTAHYRQETGSTRFRVVGRDEVVLTGAWSQDRVKCDPGRVPGEPVRELKFTDAGEFGATYQPFESYVDWWGTVAFDPKTGAVVLTPTGGNFTPPLLDLEGTARVEGDRRLILDGVYLGDRNERNFEPRTDPATGQFVVNPDGSLIVDRPVCTYEFVR